MVDGRVAFERKGRDKKQVSVYPVATEEKDKGAASNLKRFEAVFVNNN